jgi:hypothetical protein
MAKILSGTEAGECAMNRASIGSFYENFIRPIDGEMLCIQEREFRKFAVDLDYNDTLKNAWQPVSTR